MTLSTASATDVHADARYCVREFFRQAEEKESDEPDLSLGFAAPDVEQLVGEVASAIGLDTNGITVISCSEAMKAEATYFGDDDDAPIGEYIVYDPIWLREVIGKNRPEAIALFGHELGHILNRHWTTNKSRTRLQKETEADKFAGCAVGALGLEWASLESLLSRIRGDVETTYPSRENSLKAARSGFDQCSRGAKSSLSYGITSSDNVVKVAYEPDANWGDELPKGHTAATQDFYWTSIADEVKFVKAGTNKVMASVTCSGLSWKNDAVMVNYPQIGIVSCPYNLTLVDIARNDAINFDIETPNVIDGDTDMVAEYGGIIFSKHAYAPCLHLWDLNIEDPLQPLSTDSIILRTKFACDGKITAFSVSNGRVVVGLDSGQIDIWTLSDAPPSRTSSFQLPVPNDGADALIDEITAFDSNNRTLTGEYLIRRRDNVVYLLDVNETDGQAASIEKIEYPGEGVVVTSARVSRNGRTLIMGTSDGAVSIWNIRERNRVASYFHDDSVNAVGFAARDDIVVSGGDDKTLRTYRISTAEPVDRRDFDREIAVLDVDRGRGHVVVGEGLWSAQDGEFRSSEWALSASGKIRPLE